MAESFKVGQAPWEVAKNDTPDKFKVGEAPWETESKKSGDSAKSQTALEHFGNSLLMGYLPQAQAGAEKIMIPALNAITGKNVETDDYTVARDKNADRLKKEAEDNPKTALGANLAGSAVQAGAVPIPGSMVGKTLIGGAAKGAALGGAQGFLANPGEDKGEVNYTQLPDRIQNAMKGGLIGGGLGAVTGGVVSKLGKTQELAQDFANSKAVKASGGMLKDFRSMIAKKIGSGEDSSNELQRVGKFALDKGIVKAGDDYESIAQKAEALRQDSGKKLDDVYSTAKGVVEKGREGDLANTGFHPETDKKAILDEVSSALGKNPDKKAAINKVSQYMDDLAEDYKDKKLTPSEQQEIKTEIDKQINYARNPLTKQPAMEEAWKAARRFISDKIDKDIEAVGKASGDEGLFSRLKEANLDYGSAKKIRDMAQDRLNREIANRQFGLTDTIAGGAGAEAGGHIGGAPGALIGGAIGAAGNKLSRTYGPAVQADIANRYANSSGGRVLDKLGAPLGTLRDVMPKGLIQRAILEKELDESRRQK